MAWMPRAVTELQCRPHANEVIVDVDLELRNGEL